MHCTDIACVPLVLVAQLTAHMRRLLGPSISRLIRRWHKARRAHASPQVRQDPASRRTRSRKGHVHPEPSMASYYVPRYADSSPFVHTARLYSSMTTYKYYPPPAHATSIGLAMSIWTSSRYPPARPCIDFPATHAAHALRPGIFTGKSAMTIPIAPCCASANPPPY